MDLKEMDSIEFATVFEPVVQLFGQQKFPQVRIGAFHQELKHFSHEEIEELVDFILKNYFSPPTINELKKSAYAIFDKAVQRREKIINNFTKGRKCDWCANTGIMDAVSRGEDLQMFAFRCKCIAGKYKANGVGEWTDNHAEYFKILKATNTESTNTIKMSLKDLPQLKSL
ncbi:MAG: hypothetical protein CL674_14360 [Bdellovibrionaceae bacterium]|jgi:hypothetical protein|nr:hypothetical protein [Pseudobdellovibrionaceae bacterium]MAF92450.1 hypothetical protein [Pseudobdellovibrionaceae bacterium]QDP47593.1 MAG: hypothetical protein GOVbin1174_41 [Prokaryotic dsDNA virus sp.]|tara:strand:+ start:1947 stop:2459 length:513 start_codon:yes stop_codon:yes gene_type:complete